MLTAFTIKHWGPGGEGSGTSVVVARNRTCALRLLRAHFDGKPDGHRQFQTMELLEVEPFEESSLANHPVSTASPGVKLEFWFPPDEEREDLVFVANAEELAEDLDVLQAVQLDGRGVECIRTMCAFLRRGMLTQARAVSHNESDKIRSFPAIVAKLREVGFWFEIKFN